MSFGVGFDVHDCTFSLICYYYKTENNINLKKNKEAIMTVEGLFVTFTLPKSTFHLSLITKLMTGVTFLW